MKKLLAFFLSLAMVVLLPLVAYPQSGCVVPANGAVVKTVGYTAVLNDLGKLIVMNCSAACTLTLPATPPSPIWSIWVESIGAGQVTIGRNGKNLNGAAADLLMPAPLGTTFFVSTDNSDYFAVGVTSRARSLGWVFGDVAVGSTLTTSEVGYVTVPFACTITGWHIMADAGTVTVRVARVNAGTALPTLASNSTTSTGVALASGTKIDSTTLTAFDTPSQAAATAIATNDTLGFFITAVATAKQVTVQLDCQQ